MSLYLENKDAILVLADDYVGTGETAEKCLLHILKMKVEINQIAIVSLVAQQMGLDYLSKYKNLKKIAIISSSFFAKIRIFFYMNKTY